MPHLSIRRLALPLVALLLAFTGCRSVKQDITITTVPPGARVFVAGEFIGVSPVKLSLDTKHSHNVRLEREGYQSKIETIHSVPNAAAGNVVRFGLVDRVGGYRQLSPEKLEVELVSNLVPPRRGLDPFGELAERVVQLDTRLAAGEISSEEHRIIQGQLLRFFR